MTLVSRYSVLCGLLYLTMATAGSYDTERSELVAFGFDGFDPGINHLISKGDAKEKLLRRFGEPLRVESTTQWENAGLMQTKTWHYDGLKIVTARPVGTSRHWLRKISLTSPNYKLKFGLSLGDPRYRFIERLGPPHPSFTNPNRAELGYFASYEGSEDGVAVHSSIQLSIHFDDEGRAEKIIWEYFAD